MDSDSKVEQFLVLLKMCKGNGIGDVVAKATGDPGLFVFSELLSQPNVEQLKGTEHEAIHRTLELFAYGTWMDYKGAPHLFMPLNERQITKLKQLTVCTLAQQQKTLDYAFLLNSLDLSSVRELEDFVIQHCIYPALLRCKLDHAQRCVCVQDVFPRDVKPDQVAAVVHGLDSWLGQIRDVMDQLTGGVSALSSAHAATKQDSQRFQEQVEQLKKTLKSEMQRSHEEGSGGEEPRAPMPMLPGQMSRVSMRAGSSRIARGAASVRAQPDPKRRR